MVRIVRCSSRLRVAAALGLALALAGSARAQTNSAKAAPPLSRYVPKNDLVTLLEFDGLDAHSAAWKGSAASKILNETKLGALLEDVLGQLLDKALAGMPPSSAKPTAAQAVVGLEYLLKKGFVVAVFGKPTGPPGVVIVARGATSAEGEKAVGFLRKMMETAPEKTTETRKGRKLTIVGGGSFWSEKDDLIIALPPIATTDAILAVIEGKSPNAATLPILAELAKVEDGFTPALRGFVDFAALPALPPQAVALGVDGLKRMDLRMGFQDDALVTSLRVIAPAPRRGLLAMLDGPTFTAKTLPPVPAGLTSFTAMSLDLDGMFTKYAALMKQTNDPSAAGIERAEQGVKDALGLRLREDILAHLGPKMAFYAKAGAGAALPLPNGMMMAIPEVTTAAETDDPAAAGKALDAILGLLIRQVEDPANRRPNAPPLPTIKKLDDAPGYEVILPPQMAQGPLAAIRPTILIGKGIVAASTTPATARAALALGSNPSARWSPNGEFAAMARRLPEDMILLNVNDPRESLPQVVAGLPQIVPLIDAAINQAGGGAAGPFLRIDPAKVPRAEELSRRLFPGSVAVVVDKQGLEVVSRDALPSIGSPATSGVAIALLLPAVQSAREAARRAQCANNLKQIAIAMHNYEAVNGTLPPAATRDKGGKPLLSWRVAILPYIEQQALYNEFHLDEPWDSPHNKTLIDKMPATYACPSRRPQPGTTTYRVFTGKGTLFDDPKGVRFAEVTDGLSNTIAVVEFKEPIPWTKPDDVAFGDDPAAIAAKLGSDHPGGFQAMLADGSVRFIKSTIDKTVLRKLFTRNGGEVVQLPN